jgi:hypothetical protein
MRISESDFKQWWANPVGQEVKNMLRDRIYLINDKALTSEVIRDQIKSAEFLGRKLEIQDLLEMNFKELMGEE